MHDESGGGAVWRILFDSLLSIFYPLLLLRREVSGEASWVRLERKLNGASALKFTQWTYHLEYNPQVGLAYLLGCGKTNGFELRHQCRSRAGEYSEQCCSEYC